MARLGEICKFQSGGTPSKGEASYFNGNIPWITTVALNGKSINEKSTVDWITEKAIEKSAAKIVPANSVMVGTRVGVGKVAINEIAMSTSQDIISLIEIDESKWSKSFICKFIQGKGSYLNSQARGATIKGIKIETLAGLQLPDITIEEQNRIADVLDIVENLISLRKEQLAKLDELVKARFVEMFGDPITNRNGYVLKKYGDLFELNAGGTPSKQKPEYWDNGTISWIGSNMCQNTVIYENDGNCITEEGLKHSSAKMFPVDTVLIALVGATIGKTALLKFETTTNQNVLGVRGIRENGYTPEFIFYYTQGLYQKFQDIGDGGFAMASKGFISELPVPVVDLALQEQFASFVEQTNKTKLTIQASLDKLEVMKKALMQEYFG